MEILIHLKIALNQICLALTLCGAGSPSVVVFEGDSLISETNTTWPKTIQGLTPWRAQWHHVGINGSTTADVIARDSSSKFKAEKQASGVLFLNIGTNDLMSGERDAAATYANMKQVWAKGRRDGYKIVAFTMHSVPCGSTCEIERVKLNAEIRSNPSLYDALVPLDTIFPNYNDRNMFHDKIHFADGGNTRVVEHVTPILRGLK